MLIIITLLGGFFLLPSSDELNVAWRMSFKKIIVFFSGNRQISYETNVSPLLWVNVCPLLDTTQKRNFRFFHLIQISHFGFIISYYFNQLLYACAVSNLLLIFVHFWLILSQPCGWWTYGLRMHLPKVTLQSLGIVTLSLMKQIISKLALYYMCTNCLAHTGE